MSGASDPQAAARAGWVPDACTLPAAERPLRAADFDRLFADAVLGIEQPAPDRLHLELRPGPQVAARVAELAAAETECCSFFTFSLTASGGRLALDITVPPAHTAVLAALASRATEAAGAAPA